MEMCKVTFQPQNRTVAARKGDSLIRAAMEAGVHINASCGGEGVCGKCRVVVETGEVDGGVSERLAPADRERGYRLACRARVTGDVTIRIPVESAVDASVLNLPPPPGKPPASRPSISRNSRTGGFSSRPWKRSFWSCRSRTPRTTCPM